MKGLSLLQPWASLVAFGAKRYETRSWSTAYRGKSFPRHCKNFAASMPCCHAIPYSHVYQTGAIVAFCRLAGVWPVSDKAGSAIVFGQVVEAGSWEFAFGDYTPGRFAWQLEDVVRLDAPIPCRGSLGLWEVPAAVMDQLNSLPR